MEKKTGKAPRADLQNQQSDQEKSGQIPRHTGKPSTGPAAALKVRRLSIGKPSNLCY
jgi:hypothetical protein